VLPLFSVNKMTKILKNITIEELVEVLPESVKLLKDRGIRCIICGEPIWGTLEEAAKEKSITDDELEAVVQELNNLASHK